MKYGTGNFRAMIKGSYIFNKSKGIKIGICTSRLLITRKNMKNKKASAGTYNISHIAKVHITHFATDRERSAWICAIVFPSAHWFGIEPLTVINWPALVSANNIHSTWILLDLAYIFHLLALPFNRKSRVSDVHALYD